MLGRVFNRLREQYKYRGDGDETEEGGIEFFVASANASRALQLLEEVFDEVTFFVRVFIDIALQKTAISRRNDYAAAVGRKRLNDGI